MKKKEHNKKSFFRRKRQPETEEGFRIIRDDELFEDVADYDEEMESGEESFENDGQSALEDADDSSEEMNDEEPDNIRKAEEEYGEDTPEKAEAEGKSKEAKADGLEEGAGELEEEADESEEEWEDDQDELDDDIGDANLDEEEREPTEAEIAYRKHLKRKRALIAVASVLGVLVVVYLGISAYFYSHFYYNTVINGTNVSMNTVSQVQDHMEGEVAGYSLRLDESGGKEEFIVGTDISLKYVRDDSLKKLLEKQNPFLWITALWQTPEIEASVGVEYDEEKLNEVIAALNCMKPEEQTPSVSARPEFQETQFEIKAEEIGTQIDSEKFAKAVNEAISGFLPEISLKEAGCYILPAFTAESPEVAAAKDAMNSYLGANITLDFSPYTEVVDSSVISQWISVDENMQVTFNQDLVREYIASLAEKYDTYGKPRTFTTGFGNTVQVEGGSYGWQIDQETEYNALTANIQNAETVTREPNYLRRGATHEGNDFGNTYAEVDLTNQHMFYFKDGQCVLQSDIVTGNPNKGHATPQGVYSLAYKAPNQVLRGKKLPDGTYEYESPVSYWMPFNGGIGFHDATWQSAFGGSRYLTYGSHGCVNMPVEAAGQLYSYIEAGVPVVCHY